MSMSGDVMRGDDMSNMPQHQTESIEGIKSMDMMKGRMKKDPDVAFSCRMIAQHMGAISMAETELTHGKDKASKARAQQINNAQKKEIKEMSAWVEKHVK